MEHWRNILNALPIGVLLIDKKKRGAFANSNLINISCLGLPELSNTANCLDRQKTLEKESLQLVFSSMEKFKEAGKAHSTLKSIMESNNDKSAGRNIYEMIHCESNKEYEVEIASIQSNIGKEYKIAILKDQTTYQQLVKQKTLDKYQKMLLASLSHEIKNPLNAIEAYTTTIWETSSLVEAKKKGACIKSSARQIFYSLSGACEIMLHDTKSFLARTFNLKEAVNEAADLVLLNLEEKGLTFRICYEETVPEIIKTDCQKYKLILFNLLANAVKFTNEGFVNVKVSYHPGEGTLSTTVADTGIGMDERTVHSLFELYAKVDIADKCNPQGMGLGLNLCKKLSQILGGDILVTSKLGEGTSIEFTIKLDTETDNKEDNEICIPNESNPFEELKSVRIFIPHSNPLEASPRRAIASQCSCSSVLIVDDEPTNRLVLLTYLKEINVISDQALNGLIALNMVKDREKKKCCKKYKLVLMDINMPIMDGTEATKELTKMFKEKSEFTTPIIAVTAVNLNTNTDYTQLLDIGFIDVCNALL